MINYVIQVLLFQALFLAVYDFFLRRETFFKWNRIYLLITPLLSFVIPLIKFESLQNTLPQEYIVQLPEIIINPQVVIEQSTSNSTIFNYFPIIVVGGIILFALLFLIRLSKIIVVIKSSKVIDKGTYQLVILKDRQSAFSFFKYIFINELLLLNKEQEIVQHELVHCNQFHTFDLLLFELMKIVLWFNPLIYVYQQRITLLHEYISDSEIVKKSNRDSYFNSVLAATFNVENISFINQFFNQSLIKKRIIMITKNKSRKIKQLKYLLIVPVLLAMLIYTSCEQNSITTEAEMNTKSEKDKFIAADEILIGHYFDRIEVKNIPSDAIRINVATLSSEELKEFNQWNKFNNSYTNLEIYQLKEDKKSIAFIVDKAKLKEHFDKLFKDKDDVPFAAVDVIPVYPGCEGTQEELKSCFSENIAKFINKNFKKGLASSLGLPSGEKRVFVMFKIDKEGNVVGVMARAPHKALKEEAIRVIKMLPKMTPGQYNGKTVGVKYSLPIAFMVG